jgi:hypothetical protein
MNEPVPDCVMFLSRVVEMALEETHKGIDLEPKEWIRLHYNQDKMFRELEFYERQEVVRRPLNAKLIVSPTYSRVKKLYLQEITENILSRITINADDDQREGTGETHDDEAITTDGVSEEETNEESECETDEGTDAGDSEGSEGDTGDEVYY